jgi:hypothetical protein
MAVNQRDPPTPTVAVGVPVLTAVTGTVVIVAVVLAVNPELSERAVIVAVPALTAVTTPCLSTVATAGLLDVQIRVRLPAFNGWTSWSSPRVRPTARVKLVGDTVTLVTGIAVIVTVAVAVTPPPGAVAVTVTVPGAIAVSIPDELILASDELLVAHVISFGLLASAGVSVAANCWFAPALILAVVGVTVMPVAGTKTTVTVVVAVNPPSSDRAVIVAVPGEVPVTRP